MKMFKKAVLGAAMALAFSSAQASLINVGGIYFDPDYTGNAAPYDFLAQFNFTQWFDLSNANNQTLAGAVLNGVGEVYQINDLGALVNSPTGGPTVANGGFAPGRELTLYFTGFVADGAGGFSGGTLKLYSDNHNDYFTTSNAARSNVATATNTDLSGTWLELSAIESKFTSGGYSGGTLEVLWQVTGGLAQSNFLNDPVPISRAGAFFSSVLTLSNTGANGEVNASTIPEPASLALVGLGLLGAGALRRRKAAK